MYDGSFDPDMLKNTKMKTAHTTQNRSHEKLFCARAASRQLRANVTAHTMSHGMSPRMNHGTKYHHSPVRLCDSVRKRSRCSCTKKMCRNSGWSLDTSTNHGAAIARYTTSPGNACRRRHGPKSRVSSEYNTSVAPGMAIASNPLVSVAAAAAAKAASIQLRS